VLLQSPLVQFAVRTMNVNMVLLVKDMRVKNDVLLMQALVRGMALESITLLLFVELDSGTALTVIMEKLGIDALLMLIAPPAIYIVG